MTELWQLDAIAQAELIRRGKISSLELVDAAIDRIEGIDTRLNTVVTPLFESARETASHPLPKGPLSGVPFLVKDLGCGQAGVRQTNGSRAMQNHIASADSPLVTRYREAGLVIIGRTSTPEFGNHSTTEPALFGPSRNPWALGRTTGGSSGASAAAIAAGLTSIASGGDGAGSLRIPASCCGVFGFKPSRGRVSSAPGGEAIGNLAIRHAMSRSVRDNAALLDVAAVPEPGDPFFAPPPVRPFLEEVGREPGRLRIAWTATPAIDASIDPECVAAVRSTAELLDDLGHEVVESAPKLNGEVIIGSLLAVWAAGNLEDALDCERLLGRALERDELEITTWELVEHGRSLRTQDLLEAVAAFGTTTRSMGAFFEDHDVWLTPTLARLPEPLGVLNQSSGSALGWQRMDSGFNPFNPWANISGCPSMSLPLHWSADGLPIGVLATARYGDEATLFRLAGQLEQARPWADRWPAIALGAAADPVAKG
jgi:amidase